MTGASTKPLANTARLVILADDLSGAADCAVSYAKSGLTTAIELTLQSNADAQVVVFDTDSRHLAPTEAAALNMETWRAVRSPHLRLYKKIDSTLRGNWAEEVAALILDAGMAIVAPAMPAMKRFTRDARQYIDQTPVEQTPVWGNEGCRGRASLNDMLSEAGVSVAHLSLAMLRQSSPEALGRVLLEHQRNQVGAVVCDAETDADLERLAQATYRLDVIFWAGSAGLAKALCPYLHREVATALLPPIAVEGPVLMVVGSMSPISHRQIDYLLQQRCKEIEHFQINIAELLASCEVPAALTRAQQALEAGHDVLVTLAQQTPDFSIDGYALSQRLASHLGGHLGRLGALVATGGETAKALLSAAGVEQLRLMGELEPGVALSVSGQGMPVVTKAGAFGNEATLHETWRTLVSKRTSSSCRC
ncbi:four-carbon acid sugar kinase family protein [Halomonas sp. MCCC 1A11036]|uniref:Four-carbon acid sugar kinase family protein n=1 Tax=Billgrantia zhangzhouensis TaxID=2733481 RepID=A0ABS9AFS5_9GAMM|nr:four-carbon acid sugar kinase family protein [Halomonas zhangzhouensis]MCE8020566.1 four-carbon acid sugar kinase family protein [Halomonas zhangzhouensis]